MEGGPLEWAWPLVARIKVIGDGLDEVVDAGIRAGVVATT